MVGVSFAISAAMTSLALVPPFNASAATGKIDPALVEALKHSDAGPGFFIPCALNRAFHSSCRINSARTGLPGALLKAVERSFGDTRLHFTLDHALARPVLNVARRDDRETLWL
jgi:hypothetical protein